MHLNIEKEEKNQRVQLEREKPYNTLPNSMMHIHTLRGNVQTFMLHSNSQLLVLWRWPKLPDLLVLVGLFGADGHSGPWKLQIFYTKAQTLSILQKRTGNLDVCHLEANIHEGRCCGPLFMIPFSFSSPTTCTFTGLYLCGVFRPTHPLLGYIYQFRKFPFKKQTLKNNPSETTPQAIRSLSVRELLIYGLQIYGCASPL